MLTNKSILDSDITPVRASDTVAEAIEKMDRLNVSKLPVTENTTQKLIGQLSLRSLREASDEDKPVSDYKLDEAIKVFEGQHIFEAVRLMLQYELNLLPVVDEEWTFLGFINKQQVLEMLSRMLNLAEFGSVITVQLDQRDFSISEVVHLIEVEGAKILGLTVETPEEEEQSFDVSIKLNLKDVSRVAAALRRYGYTVHTESSNEAFGRDLETKADELIKYIDM